MTVFMLTAGGVATRSIDNGLSIWFRCRPTGGIALATVADFGRLLTIQSATDRTATAPEF